MRRVMANAILNRWDCHDRDAREGALVSAGAIVMGGATTGGAATGGATGGAIGAPRISENCSRNDIL